MFKIIIFNIDSECSFNKYFNNYYILVIKYQYLYYNENYKDIYKCNMITYFHNMNNCFKKNIYYWKILNSI